MSYKGSQSGYNKYAPSPTKHNPATNRSSEHSNPTGSQSKTSTAPPTKYNIPCKYYKSGICKLGDQCRFLHQGKVDSPVRKYNTKQTTTDQSTSNTNNYSNGNYTTAHSTHAHSNEINFDPIATSTPVNSRVGRKPYLHIVVLYASDIRVLKYAKEIHTLFLDNGVDVFLHSEVNVKNGMPPERVNKETEIKTENLAEIITTSRADYLVVLGDRNMKNRTCQAKNKGKLTEMDVGDMLKALWAEWSQAQGLNDEDFDVDSADDESVQELLDKYTGVKHIKDRYNKLLDNMAELKDTKQWRAVVGSDDDSNDSESNDEDSDNSDDGYRSKRERRVAALTTDESYRSIASKMTQIQKGLIRLHEQLVDAEQLITNLPILESEIDQSEPGDMVGFDFQPSTTPTSIAEHVKEYLLTDIRSMIESIEEQGNQLTAFGAPLWAGYIEGYNQKLKDADEQPTPVSPIEIQLKPGQWQCSFCTYVNEEDQHACRMCTKKKQSGKPDEVSESSEWEVSGTAAKKLRKQQQRQQQEKEPEPEVKYVPKDTSEKRRSEPRPAPVAAAAEPKAAAPKQALTPVTTPVKTAPQPVPSLPTNLAPKQAANGTLSTSPSRISPQPTPNGTTIQPVVPSQQLNLTPQTVPSLSLLAQQINKPAQPVVSATPFLSNNDFFSSSSLANLLQLNSALQQQNNNALLVNNGQTSPQPYQPDYEENFPPLGGAPQVNAGAKKTSTLVPNANANNSNNTVNVNSQLPLNSLLRDTAALNPNTNTISTPEIGFLSFNNTNTSANNQASQGGSWNPLQSSLYPQSGALGQYPPLNQPFAQLSVSNTGMGAAQPKMSAGVLPQPKMQQQPDFNLISGLWSKEPTPTPNMTSFNTNTMNSNPNTNQSSLLSQPFDPWKSPFQSPSPQPITPPPQQRSNLLNNLSQPGLPLNVQNNFFASNPLFNANTPLAQPNLLANPYTPLNNQLNTNTPSNTTNISHNNTSTSNSTEVQPSNSTTNATSFPNNLTISLANLQNKRSFNPYSQQNMLIGEFSEEFIREMQKAREVTEKKYANIPKPNRPCCYCGEESQLECNLCANVGLATYFCSAQHQSLVWKQHLLFHKTAFNLQ